MERRNLFQYLSVSEAEFKTLLAGNGYKCNADGRRFMAEHVQVLSPRCLPNNPDNIYRLAEKIGGCLPGKKFNYPTPHGIMTARVCSLYDLPCDMVNPRVLYFSGHMMAPIYAIEAIRWYAKQTGELLDSGSTGKEGNKGLFLKVFDREEGIVIGTEYGANYNVAEMLAPRAYVRKHEREFLDTDTKENLLAQYQMALAEGLDEITLVLVTGQPWYDRRLLAEWMYELRKDEYKEVKINLVLAHCPIWLEGETPEAKVSEISLGYIAASIGPLCKDTISFEGETFSDHPERYLMPGVMEADWLTIEPVIRRFNNMGWPNYSELLYCTPHEEAVEEVILADLFARESFTAEDYDNGIKADVAVYQQAVGKFEGTTEEDFLNWCIDSPDVKFF